MKFQFCTSAILAVPSLLESCFYVLQDRPVVRNVHEGHDLGAGNCSSLLFFM